jgi:hypothetical protein
MRTSVKIIFMPDDDVWTGFHRSERQRGEGFILFPHDRFLLRYEDIDIETLDYYLNNRLDRQNYLSMMPVLKGLKKRLLEEQAAETQFATLLAREIACTDQQMAEAIQWWKTKVISKRALTQDDAKAWRMIRQKLTRR